ncbi:hypothetical protein ACGFYT_15045 [Streptomyces sp. NPDC048208]|uniref:hypothetical protein n=1 Tax=Streptomyces sp. NPDC048208 TaxID=3365515 RepID=UPI003710795D
MTVSVAKVTARTIPAELMALPVARSPRIVPIDHRGNAQRGQEVGHGGHDERDERDRQREAAQCARQRRGWTGASKTPVLGAGQRR